MGLTQKLGTIPLAIFTDASNNIGIGGSPSGSFKFDVTGTGRFTGALTGTSATFSGAMVVGGSSTAQQFSVFGANDPRAEVVSTGNNSAGTYFRVMNGATMTGNATIRVTNSGALELYSGGASDALRMIINSSGNLGVGTDTPGARLQVVGGDIWLGSYHATNKLALGADTNHYLRYSSAIDGVEVSGYQGILFTTLGGTEKMRLSSAGDLYIGGTTSLSSGALLIGNNSSTRPIVILGANGVDGSYTTGIAFYPWNTAENNLIQTTVSGSASVSGFRFMVSNGYGTTGVTESFRINRTSCTVIGSLSKGSGSFKIDHPIETMKDTHHLVHSFVESPQANNIYRGKVQLVNGKAQVNLDEVSTMTDGTFVLLNREIHIYTSNETDWDAVRGKVEGNILTIECQNIESNAIVTWLVIGERQDKHIMDTDWTDENGKVIVEPLKEITPLENNS